MPTAVRWSCLLASYSLLLFGCPKTPATGADAGVPCTGAACVPGADAGVTDGGDKCAGVICVPSQCLEDATACDPSTGLCTKARPDGTGCDDGSACTQVDSCQAGACVGANPVQCTAQGPCHDVGACDPQTGQCSTPLKADGSACDDGDGCTAPDTCQSGTCTGALSCPRVAAGYGHSCAVFAGGELWCWGSNTSGQLGDGTRITRGSRVRVGTATWDRIATGQAHSCGIHTDGTLWCWGSNAHGQTGTGSGTWEQLSPVQVGTAADWESISAGSDHTCGIRSDKALWCWGSGGFGQLGLGSTTQQFEPTRVGDATDWVAVSAGEEYTCGTRADGTLWCWGHNTGGQAGSGGTGWGASITSPQQVGTATDWKTPAAADESLFIEWSTNYRHSCATKADGTLWCWGDNGSGKLGDGTMGGARMTPAQVDAGSNWSEVVAGGQHSCALRSGGTLWCWGDNSSGQLGNGTTLQSSLPVQVVGSGYYSVSSRSGHGCASRPDGTVWCWGANFSGQLGLGTVGDKTEPTQIGSERWAEVRSGSWRTCGVTTDGGASCWGANYGGEVGDGTRGNRRSPFRIGADSWKTVSTGAGSCSFGDGISCGVRADGTLWCWGNGADPTQVGTDADWIAASAGGGHACGIRSNGTLWCWGQNSAGQVGDGTFSQRLSPVQISADTNWASVSAGRDHTCALTTTGMAHCWGNDYCGTVGNGQQSPNQNVPYPVGVTNGIVKLVAGSGRTCAIDSTGRLLCWGCIGDFNQYQVYYPRYIGTDSNWASIGAGEGTCGVRSDGTLWCWDSALTSSNGFSYLPRQVGTASNWSAVSVGGCHQCATRTDDTLWCWGNNHWGQLGDGTAWSESPTQVP